MEAHPLDGRTGRFPWQAALVFVAVAAISRAPALVVLAFGAVLTWIIVEITGRLALSAVEVRVSLSPAPARGAYAIGPLRLRAGDWLGFTQTERTVPLTHEVIAYPAPLAVRDRALASLRPLAETATRRGLVPDPLRFRGVRPHRRGDA